jgi:hypothetical protein
VEERVAAPGHGLAHAPPFGADHQRDRRAQVRALERLALPRAGVEHAHALGAERVDGTEEVRDARDREALGGIYPLSASHDPVAGSVGAAIVLLALDTPGSE